MFVYVGPLLVLLQMLHMFIQSDLYPLAFIWSAFACFRTWQLGFLMFGSGAGQAASSRVRDPGPIQGACQGLRAGCAMATVLSTDPNLRLWYALVMVWSVAFLWCSLCPQGQACTRAWCSGACSPFNFRSWLVMMCPLQQTYRFGVMHNWTSQRCGRGLRWVKWTLRWQKILM